MREINDYNSPYNFATLQAFTIKQPLYQAMIKWLFNLKKLRIIVCKKEVVVIDAFLRTSFPNLPFLH